VSPHRSIAEEKEALLARMQASRVAYRRMLQDTDDATAAHSRSPNAFPRSKTIRWIRDHPYLTAFAVAALVIGPRRVARTAVRGGKAAAGKVSRNRDWIRIAFGVATTVARFAGRRQR
jgi:hypothetical protein